MRRAKTALLGCGLTVLFAVEALAAGSPIFRLNVGTTALDKQPARWTTKPGPWGTIDVKSTYLEAPQTLIDLAQKPDQVPLWRFPGGTAASIQAVLAKARLPAAIQAELLDPKNVRVESGGLTLIPPPAILVGLAPEARQTIYVELAKYPANSFHANPLPLPGNIGDWLLESRLTPVQRTLFQRLLWTRGSCHVFSDISLLISVAESGREIAAVLSTQTRVQTLVATIRVPPPAEAEAVLEYWRADRNNNHVLPFFRSTIGREGVNEVDLIYLLPRLCRARLFTYPTLADSIGGKLPDCHWTALNFFEINYQPYYLGDRSAYLDLVEAYAPIDEPSRLGDLICFVTAAERILHSCVYVADDIVFTKNGDQLFSPWLLQRFSDVAAVYGHGDVTGLRFLRRKQRPPAES